MKLCRHETPYAHCAECRPAAVEKAARKLFTVKGRYHSQIAMCELGELLGYPVVWPENVKGHQGSADDV